MENPKVLIIYTGGTIGMINDPETGVLKPFDFEHLYKSVPELKQFQYTLEAISLGEPIDSSEMQPSNWADIAKTIFDNYVSYDGFVVLHGSDTMAYTSSALSFMLQGLKKPVILTGSQLPIGQIRTDGKENIITSIEIAGMRNNNGEPAVQEVALYFEYSLYRGNRAKKISSENFEAFASPNYPNLAEAGVNIQINDNALYKSKLKALKLNTTVSDKVALIKLYPGMPIHALKSLFNFDLVKGIVIESYGSGNSFTNSTFAKMVSDFIAQGGIILNITQCVTGGVAHGKYETSKFFTDYNIISGGDMTSEAALIKMMHILGQDIDRDEKIKRLSEDLCGELT